MQRFFTYGRKRRKAPDVSDVRLPDTAWLLDAERNVHAFINTTKSTKLLIAYVVSGFF